MQSNYLKEKVLILVLLIVFIILMLCSCNDNNTEKLHVPKCLTETIGGNKYTVQCYVIYEDENRRLAVNGIIDTRNIEVEEVDVFMYIDTAEMVRFKYPSKELMDKLIELIKQDYINEVQFDTINVMLYDLYIQKELFNKRFKK